MSTGERVSWFFSLLGAALVAAPFVSEDYQDALGDGAFALMFVGGIMGLTAFIMVFLFRSRNRHRRNLIAGRDLLARWIYTADEWRAFAPGETRRLASDKGMLLKITAGMMLVATVVMVLINRRAAIFVGGVLGGTWLLCWAIVRAQVRRQRKLEQAPPPEIRISAHALLIGDQLHAWSGFGNRLEQCVLHENAPPKIAITYSTPGRHSRPTETVCVPIPAGRAAEAAALVQRLAARH
jgi:Flp pilus assembly protein TadB